mgnify:CR=1 FL=1
MPYDSNGNYFLPSEYKAVAGKLIVTTQHNGPFEDVAAALNAAFLRSGATPMTGNFNAGSNRLINVANGTADTDAATVDQLNGKANLSGGNNLTGPQAITDGNQFMVVGEHIEVSSGVYDTKLIKGTAPSGTEYQITLREYAGSHFSMMHHIYDGTNFSIYEMPQTAYNGGRLQCSAGTGAVLEDFANYQPKGDYATTQSLSAEAQTRASADGTLQTNINNEAQTRASADGTLQTNINNEMQARIAADDALNSAKANLSGGNNLTGPQAITDGNQFMVVGEHIEVSSGVYDTKLIKGTAPSGTEYQITLREYAGSHFSMMHHIYDGTNFSIYEMPQTAYNGGRLQCPAGTGAVLSDLPFSDPNLKMQIFSASVAKSGGQARVNFPTAFKAGTVPFVFMTSTRSLKRGYACIPMFQDDASGNPLIDNKGFTIYTTTGSGDNNDAQYTQYLAIGYF